MKTEQVIRLLAEKNIKIVDEGDSIYHDNTYNPNISLEEYYMPLEEHDKIILIDDKWHFCEVQPRMEPKEKIKQTFVQKEEALEYLFLNKLFSYFMNKYVLPGRKTAPEPWDMNVLKYVMMELGIPEKYLCTMDSLEENSICVLKKDNLWFEAYVGSSGKILEESYDKSLSSIGLSKVVLNYIDSSGKKLEIPGVGYEKENRFFRVLLNSVYCLYLLDNYMDELIERGEITTRFSETQVANFLGYDIQETGDRS